MVEIFTLVTWLALSNREERRLGFSKTECERQAALVQLPNRARCEFERLQGSPMQICGFGKCWMSDLPNAVTVGTADAANQLRP